MAITIKVRLDNRMGRVVQLTEKTAQRALRVAAFQLSSTAKQSITRAPKDQRTRAKRSGGVIVRRARHEPSPPGTPPYTQGIPKHNLKGAIRYDATKDTLTSFKGPRAYIGPIASVVGTSGMAHEFGGRYKKETYPERPFMFPALVKTAGSFAGQFAGRLGR